MATDHISDLQKSMDDLADDREFLGHVLSLNIAEQVATELYARGHNQTWLGTQLGVSRQRVSNLLLGTPNMTIQTLVNLSGAFGFRTAIHIDESQCPAFVSGDDHERKKTEAAIYAFNAADSSTAGGDVLNAAD